MHRRRTKETKRTGREEGACSRDSFQLRRLSSDLSWSDDQPYITGRKKSFYITPPSLRSDREKLGSVTGLGDPRSRGGAPPTWAPKFQPRGKKFGSFGTRVAVRGPPRETADPLSIPARDFRRASHRERGREVKFRCIVGTPCRVVSPTRMHLCSPRSCSLHSLLIQSEHDLTVCLVAGTTCAW